MRSILPRKTASVFVRAPLMRRSSGSFGRPTGSGENQKLAHLFMICSNIKLTWPMESIGIGTPAIHERNQRDSGMDIQRKLEILADAAKYDASCASSGTEKQSRYSNAFH